jgi:hypothetical protein
MKNGPYMVKGSLHGKRVPTWKKGPFMEKGSLHEKKGVVMRVEMQGGMVGAPCFIPIYLPA